MSVLKNALYFGCVAGFCGALSFGLVACGSSSSGSNDDDPEETLSSSSSAAKNVENEEGDDELESSSSVKAVSSSSEEIEEFNPAISYGEFKDDRNKLKYKTVPIGNQLWMAENLNYKSSYSVCYKAKSENCEDFGALYQWSEAQNVCPDGWHLPSKAEWQELIDFAGSTPGSKLKATFGWDDDGNGSDKFGFRVLAAGYKKDTAYLEMGDYAAFWSSDEFDTYNAFSWRFTSTDDGVKKNSLEKSIYRSVRCVNDRSVNSKYDVEVMTNTDLKKYPCTEKEEGQTAYIKDVELELFCRYDDDVEDYMWVEEEEYVAPKSSSDDEEPLSSSSDEEEEESSSSAAVVSSSSVAAASSTSVVAASSSSVATVSSSSAVAVSSSVSTSGHDFELDKVDELLTNPCNASRDGMTAYVADIDLEVYCTYDDDEEEYMWTEI